MKPYNLANLAYKHIRNNFLEEMYLRTGVDKTRPIVVYGGINERCNYKCRYCGFWQEKNYMEEMSIEEWKNALISLKEYIGTYHIEFSGGEPFLKKGFVDLIEFCHKNKLKWGVTTNGSSLTDPIIKRVVAAQPFNLNISIDSHIAEVHDYARGVPGSFERITRQLKALIAARNSQGLAFPIIVKPTVHSKNLHLLTELPGWVRELGATAVNFQPIDRWTPETYDELWINSDRMEELEAVVANLINQKQNGASILNSVQVLKLWPAHFREEKAPVTVGACRVGLRNYFIRPNGDVRVCWYFPPIGNVRKQSAREIWKSSNAQQIRKETVQCDRLCLFTCLSQKNILDKIKMAFVLMRK